MIAVSGLTKRFGAIVAVDDLSFEAGAGVTGFLGPNGAGKSTTMRMLLGLVSPTAGQATVGGLTYGRLARPLERVGAALETARLPSRPVRAGSPAHPRNRRRAPHEPP